MIQPSDITNHPFLHNKCSDTTQLVIGRHPSPFQTLSLSAFLKMKNPIHMCSRGNFLLVFPLIKPSHNSDVEGLIHYWNCIVGTSLKHSFFHLQYVHTDNNSSSTTFRHDKNSQLRILKNNFVYSSGVSILMIT